MSSRAEGVELPWWALLDPQRCRGPQEHAPLTGRNNPECCALGFYCLGIAPASPHAPESRCRSSQWPRPTNAVRSRLPVQPVSSLCAAGGQAVSRQLGMALPPGPRLQELLRRTLALMTKGWAAAGRRPARRTQALPWLQLPQAQAQPAAPLTHSRLQLRRPHPGQQYLEGALPQPSQEGRASSRPAARPAPGAPSSGASSGTPATSAIPLLVLRFDLEGSVPHARVHGLDVAAVLQGGAARGVPQVGSSAGGPPACGPGWPVAAPMTPPTAPARPGFSSIAPICRARLGVHEGVPGVPRHASSKRDGPKQPQHRQPIGTSRPWCGHAGHWVSRGAAGSSVASAGEDRLMFQAFPVRRGVANPGDLLGTACQAQQEIPADSKPPRRFRTQPRANACPQHGLTRHGLTRHCVMQPRLPFADISSGARNRSPHASPTKQVRAVGQGPPPEVGISQDSVRKGAASVIEALESEVRRGHVAAAVQQSPLGASWGACAACAAPAGPCRRASAAQHAA